MTLNASRTIPYAFKVAGIDGIAWIFDDSARTFICSASPCIYAEPLYRLGDETNIDEPLPDPDYFSDSLGAFAVAVALDLDSEDAAPGVPESEAWDTAREAAHANHRI
jgi:hypothetical protein